MNKTLLRDRKRWRIKQIVELDEQKCTQKIGILPGLTNKWRIKRIHELNDDELDVFHCNMISKYHNFSMQLLFHIKIFCMATSYFIWITGSGSGWKGNDIQSNSKKSQYPAGLNRKIRIVYTTGPHTTFHAHTMMEYQLLGQK